MAFGGRRRPSSRRDRRRSGAHRRPDTRGADRTFLILAGVFALLVLAILLGIALASGG